MAKKHMQPALELFKKGFTRKEISVILSISYGIACESLSKAGVEKQYRRAPSTWHSAQKKMSEEREDEVVKLRESGLKFGEIGDRFGFSQHRARRLYTKGTLRQAREASVEKQYRRAPSTWNSAQRKMSEEREDEVVKLRESGLTFEEIGDRLGFSRQRAQQIYTKGTLRYSLSDIAS